MKPGDSLRAVLALGQMLSLERKLVVHGRTRRSSEVGHSDQVLEVIGEPAERKREATEISGVIEGIAILQIDAGSVVSRSIDNQRVVHPFAYLV